jgi:hypothetical protein
MKTSILTLAFAALLTIAAPVIAQDAPAEQSQPTKVKADKKRLFKAGGLGCMTGGALAYLTGKKDKALTACAVGAAAGSIGSYKKQMDEARELAADAEAAGMKTTVATKQVQAKSGETVEALDQVVIAYDPDSMTAREPKTVVVLDKIAALAKKSKEPLSITAQGKNEQACEIPLAELTARGAFPPATAIDRCGSGKSQLIISPVPDLT